MSVVNKYNALIKPIYTEKSSFIKKYDKYIFEVHKDVNKIEIKKIIKELFKVDIIAVNIINYLGKQKRVGRFIGKKNDWKKAIVTCKKGENFSFL